MPFLRIKKTKEFSPRSEHDSLIPHGSFRGSMSRATSYESVCITLQVAPHHQWMTCVVLTPVECLLIPHHPLSPTSMFFFEQQNHGYE